MPRATDSDAIDIIDGLTTDEIFADAMEGASAGKVGHVGYHLGIPDATREPYSTAEEVRARFDSMTLPEKLDAMRDWVGCPWR